MSPALRYALGAVCGVLGIGVLLVAVHDCITAPAAHSCVCVDAGGAP